MDKVLLDSDVVLDFFFDRLPFAEFAAQVIGLCEAQKIKGYLTPVIYSNTYYILRQTESHRKVVEKLKQLLSITDVLIMDKVVVSSALNSGFKDFEDSLQHFSAIKNGKIDVILTRNVKDYNKSEIAVMTPETYLKSFVVK